jgi:uncharacterized protein
LNPKPQPPWTTGAHGILLTVRLTPRGGRDAVDGIEQMADGRTVLKIRVRAAASEGEANAALTRLLARTLAVPLSCVALVAGATGRVKRLSVTGEPSVLADALQDIMGASE